MTDEEILDRITPCPPVSALLWTAIVDVGDRMDLGQSRGGHRYMVPILGGQFYSGTEMPSPCGEVLQGGADRQSLRTDGVQELDALYEMRTSSGDVLTIRNLVIVDEDRQPGRYAMSTISVSAPAGAFDWLNRRLIVGTLQLARPERQAVVVRAWLMDA